MNKEVIFRGIKDNKQTIIYYDGEKPLLEVINLREEKNVDYLRIKNMNYCLSLFSECYYYNEKYIKFIDNKYQYL